MKELQTILEAIEKYGARGDRMALATIVGIRGSTYRREGARLLVTERQEMVGNISGGCLESDVMVVGEEVIHSRTPRLVSYDLTADDDAVWGLGLGCNGAIEVFIEPIDPSGEIFALLRQAIAAEQTLALLTVVRGSGPLGAKMLVRGDGTRHGTLGDPGLDKRAMRAAASGLEEGTSRLHSLAGPAGEIQVFIEVVRPPTRVVICGAGHDAIPVVHGASALGWRVVVADARDRFLTAERFPGAQRFVKADPGGVASRVPIDPWTYVLIMTHNFAHDRDLLRGFLGTAARYIGVLGPKARTEKLLDELRREGIRLVEFDLNRIYAPLGLDLGSEGPEEIAVAIIGEILAVEASRPAGFLRNRVGPIHHAANALGRKS